MDLGFLANFLGFFFNISFFKWSVTQWTDFTTQLQNGIRYFDLRVAFATDYCSESVPKDTSKIHRCFYLVHGQYASPVVDEFKAIRKFLDEHPKEFVILDFQHFHAMDKQKKAVFTRMVEESFGDLMEPERHRIPSLDELWRRKKQVIALGSEKQSNAPPSEPPSLWARNHIHQPWANTRDAEELRNFLSRNYKAWVKTNKDDRFFVFQGILSPNFDYIMNNPSSNLEKMAKISNRVVKDWLDGIDSFHGIVITDFSILGYPEFSRTVFSMNW